MVNSILEFFICNHCGNIATLIQNKNTPLVCCGEQMAELKPNTTDASTEKHLPAIDISGDNISIQIGSIPHPMEDAHHITFMYVETKQGGQYKYLSSGDDPKNAFCLTNDKVIAVYAYCNLHGLWKTAAE